MSTWYCYTCWKLPFRKVLFCSNFLPTYFRLFLCSFWSNLLGWHWLTKLHKFQVHDSIRHHLYTVLCVHTPKSSLRPSPHLFSIVILTVCLHRPKVVLALKSFWSCQIPTHLQNQPVALLGIGEHLLQNTPFILFCTCLLITGCIVWKNLGWYSVSE